MIITYSPAEPVATLPEISIDNGVDLVDKLYLCIEELNLEDENLRPVSEQSRGIPVAYREDEELESLTHDGSSKVSLPMDPLSWTRTHSLDFEEPEIGCEAAMSPSLRMAVVRCASGSLPSTVGIDQSS